MKTCVVKLEMEITSNDSKETVLWLAKAIARVLLFALNVRDIARWLWHCARPWWMEES